MPQKYKLIFVGQGVSLIFSIALTFVFYLYVFPTGGSILPGITLFYGVEHFLGWDIFTGLIVISLIAPILQKFRHSLGWVAIALVLLGQLFCLWYMARAGSALTGIFNVLGIFPALAFFWKSVQRL